MKKRNIELGAWVDEAELTDALPLADPAVVQLGGSNESVEVGGCAVVDVVAVVAQVQERLAVVAPVVLELLECLDGKFKDPLNIEITLYDGTKLSFI